MGTSSQTILKRKAAKGRIWILPSDREPSPARSGQEVERTVKCFPGRPCVRTRCEPGRLAVRPFRASQDFGGSIKMRPIWLAHLDFGRLGLKWFDYVNPPDENMLKLAAKTSGLRVAHEKLM